MRASSLVHGQVPLLASFLRCWSGRVDEAATGPLHGLLEERVRRARGAWPSIALEPTVFAAFLGERAAAESSATVAIEALHTDDLYLTCACAHGIPAAIRALDERFLSRLPLYLSQLSPTPVLLDDVRQALSERLLVEQPPRIAQYRGHGALDGWLRVAAARIALDVLGAQKQREGPDETAVALAGNDLELDAIKSRYRRDFNQALRDAFAALSPRDRNLIRFYYVDRLPLQRIGAVYDVHHTTVMRWITAAQRSVLEQTRALLIARLRLSAEECDSLLRLVNSQLELTLRSLIGPSST